MQREYTITEALQELKLLTKRINRQIDGQRFIDTKRSEDRNKVDETVNAQSAYQSITMLIARRAAIKSAIVVSNATTRVKIGEREYTVAEVITEKEYIKERERLLTVLKRQYAATQDEITRYNAMRQTKVDALITTTFGREANNKANPADIAAITDAYVKQYNIELVDPIKVADMIANLEKEIEEFKNTCDYKLSYINAVTKITV